MLVVVSKYLAGLAGLVCDGAVADLAAVTGRCEAVTERVLEAALADAFTRPSAPLAPATRVRHLSALRSALAWRRGRGWLVGDPTVGWARPKVPWTPSAC